MTFHHSSDPICKAYIFNLMTDTSPLAEIPDSYPRVIEATASEIIQASSSLSDRDVLFIPKEQRSHFPSQWHYFLDVSSLMLTAQDITCIDGISEDEKNEHITDWHRAAQIFSDMILRDNVSGSIEKLVSSYISYLNKPQDTPETFLAHQFTNLGISNVAAPIPKPIFPCASPFHPTRKNNMPAAPRKPEHKSIKISGNEKYIAQKFKSKLASLSVEYDSSPKRPQNYLDSRPNYDPDDEFWI